MRAEPLVIGAGRRGPRGRDRRRRALAPALVLILAAGCGPRLPSGGPPLEEPTDTTAEAVVPAEPDTVEAPPDTAAVEPDTIPPAEAEAPVDTAPPRAVRVCAGGDVLLGNNLDTLWAGRAAARLGRPVPPFPDPAFLLEPLRPLVEYADIILLNIEGAIGEGPAPRKCRPGSTRCYAFRQPTAAATALARFAEPAATVANVANNHAMDAGAEGFRTTITHLLQAGVHVTGADTLATLVVTYPGQDTIAVLGFSPFRAGPDPRDLAAVRRHVARAAARYPRLIVTMHMGAEGRGAQRTPDRSETFLGENRGNPVAFARAAVEAGASLVIGHGPHVLRGVEWQGGSLIFYSLGNLLTYGPFNMREPLNRGAIACASLDADGRVTDALLRPTWQQPPGLVSLDPSGRGTWLVDSLSQLDFPETAGRVQGDGTINGPATRR